MWDGKRSSAMSFSLIQNIGSLSGVLNSREFRILKLCWYFYQQICINKGAMTSLTNLFKRMKSLLYKISSVKKVGTKEKYQEQLQRVNEGIVNMSWGQDLERQEKQERSRAAILQKKLNAALKRQKKMDIERKKQNSRLEKLEKQQALSRRLLSTDERDLLLQRKYSEAQSPDELAEINKKLADDKKEQTRRKKIANKQSRDIRNPAKRQKLNEKFRHLNEVVGNIDVEQNDMTTRGGGILIRDVFLRNQKHTDFSFFLDAVEPPVLSIFKRYTTSKKVQLKIHFDMDKYSLLRREVVERDPGKIFSTKLKPMFHGTDLKELYDELKNDLISKFLTIQLKGSGWELDTIIKLQIFIYNYTPFSSFKNNDGNVNISKNGLEKRPILILENSGGIKRA